MSEAQAGAAPSADPVAAAGQPGSDLVGTDVPAFPVVVRIAATVMVLVLVVMGVSALADADWQQQPTGTIGWLVLLSALLVWTNAWILRSRLRIHDDAIEQSWIWPKRVMLRDITQAKIVSVRGLEWLIAPRLVVRTRGLGMHVFYCSRAKVLRDLLITGSMR